ncbi:MAK10-like protein [Tanacetum coccineum]
MTKMFELLKELTTSWAPEKVLIRKEDRHTVTKNINSISLIKGEGENNVNNNATFGNSIERPDGSDTKVQLNKVEKESEAENRTKTNQSKVLRRNPHKLKKKNQFNDSLSAARAGKMKRKTYSLLPRGPVYEAIFKKKVTKKEDIGGNFEIPCNIRGLKHMNALVDQGFDVNIMPLSTYKKLIDKRPAEMDIILSLASHSYIYPLGIAEDVLVDVDGYVYPIDFMILDIKEDEKRPFILGTPFLTTAKSVIKFDKGTITLRSGKSKMSFHRIPESLYKIEKGIKNDIEPIDPTMTVIFDEKKLGSS